MPRMRLRARGLPDGWVKRWPSGYLGPRGQVVIRRSSHRLEIVWPDGRCETVSTLKKAASRG